jgi:hypothetical protein
MWMRQFAASEDLLVAILKKRFGDQMDALKVR